MVNNIYQKSQERGNENKGYDTNSGHAGRDNHAFSPFPMVE